MWRLWVGLAGDARRTGEVKLCVFVARVSYLLSPASGFSPDPL